jgi:hypothetical protein
VNRPPDHGRHATPSLDRVAAPQARDSLAAATSSAKATALIYQQASAAPAPSAASGGATTARGWQHGHPVALPARSWVIDSTPAASPATAPHAAVSPDCPQDPRQTAFFGGKPAFVWDSAREQYRTAMSLTREQYDCNTCQSSIAAYLDTRDVTAADQPTEDEYGVPLGASTTTTTTTGANDATLPTPVNSPAETTPPVTSPSHPWEEKWDSSRNRKYYFNVETQAREWNLPAAQPASGGPGAQPKFNTKSAAEVARDAAAAAAAAQAMRAPLLPGDVYEVRAPPPPPLPPPPSPPPAPRPPAPRARPPTHPPARPVPVPVPVPSHAPPRPDNTLTTPASHTP